jgi:hypothetical protein
MNLNQTQIVNLANAAANTAYAMAHADIALIVRDQLPALVKPLVEEVHVRRHAVYTEPPRAPVSNYAQVLMSVAKWKKDKGECLGSVWMCKIDNPKEFLLIEQYGQECGVLRMDKGQPKAVLDPRQYHKVVVPGKSIWTNFATVKGLLDEVIANRKAKGWNVFQTSPRDQLNFVDV